MPTNEELNQAVEEIETTVEAHSEELERHGEKFKLDKRRIDDNVRRLDAQENDLNGDRGRLDEHEARLDDHQVKLATNEENLANYEERFKRANERLDNHNVELMENGELLVKNTNALADLGRRLETQIQEAAERDDEILVLQDEAELTQADRQEYRALWRAQMREREIRRVLHDDPNTNLRDLLNDEALEVRIEFDQLIKLKGAQEDLNEGLNQLDGNGTENARYQRLLINMSYASALMAQHYKVARNHVTAVVETKTWDQWVIGGAQQLARYSFSLALNAALGYVGGGLSGVIAKCFWGGDDPRDLKTVVGDTRSGFPTTDGLKEDAAISIANDSLKKTVGIIGSALLGESSNSTLR